jgi:hypothetical protein
LVQASSRVNPFPQGPRSIQTFVCGFAREEAAQAAENRQICDNRPTFRMPIMKKQAHLHHQKAP